MPTASRNTLGIEDVRAAAERVAGQVRHPAPFASRALDEALGHRLRFQAESLQPVGAFKIRGAVNALAWLQERGALPRRVVTYSSGNHAQAVAWAAARFGVEALIFMPAGASQVKRQATEARGARVVERAERAQAEAEAAEAGAEEGSFLLPPFDHDQVICGQGTAALEALAHPPRPDAIFVPVGGGGLMAGTTIATKGTDPSIQVIGGEPRAANDACRTLRDGALFRFERQPDTLADGARTLSISERTWHYLRMADGLIEIEEEELLYWTQWLQHLLKLHVEPTSALAMAAAHRWLGTQEPDRSVIVILSGGNVDAATMRTIWAEDRLGKPPRPWCAN